GWEQCLVFHVERFERFPALDLLVFFFFFQAEDGIRDFHVTGVQTCALPIFGTTSRRKPPARTRPASARRRTTPAGARRINASRRSEERRVGKECRSRWSRDQ